ncbi:MAG TPA: glucan biosynthesis protein, partial [Kiloniellales bacterium]|nr:glucan biosynthesis protein [Kiloniellales bacterium]
MGRLPILKSGQVVALALLLAPSTALSFGEATLPAAYNPMDSALTVQAESVARVSYAEVPYPASGTLPGDPQRIVIDFEGGQAAALATVETVQPVVTASGGEILGTYAEPLDHARGWRLVIDFAPAGERAIDLRAF